MNQNEVIESFKPDYARRHGCAWFVWGKESVHNPEKTGGWASIGGEPAFQFNRPQDLPKNIVWWTNLTKSEAWSLGRWSHIKHAGFLGPDWLSLMSECGFPQDIDSLKFSCSAWSEVLGRMGEWMSRWCANTAPDQSEVHPDWVWGDGDFQEALADRLNWNVAKSETHQALSVAFCEQIEQEFPSQKLDGLRKIMLTLPRSQHAQKIWATRYPYGSFNEINPSEWPQDNDKRWSWIANQNGPILVRFDEVIFKEQYKDLASLSWGLRGRRFAAAAMDPVWMTAEEALQMRDWIEATPSAVLRGSGWTRMSDVPLWPMEDLGFLHDNSILTGLLNEAIWRAAATPTRTPTKRIKSGTTPRSVWWRATDRRICFDVAREFMKRGFHIISYGNGTITVAFDPQKVLKTDWVEVIEKTQVRVPMALASNFAIPQEINSTNIDLWLKQKNNLENWLLLDRLLWPWMSPEKKDLKPILTHAMRTLGSLDTPNDQWAVEWKKELKLRAGNAVKLIV